MGAITTHVLDTARGRPAAGVPVVLEAQSGAGWRALGSGRTDDDGRVRESLAPEGTALAGVHRLRFDTAAYFRAQKTAAFFPEVVVVFTVQDGAEHHHVPLLLSPWGYSTYRGS